VTGRAINSAFDGYRAQRLVDGDSFLIGRFPLRLFVTAGGLICYGLDPNDPRRPAAGDVDRILKAEKLADLPVQAQTKFELVVTRKTAKRSDLPPTLLGR
jgi:putative ABC transport system substrate-binding protein